MCMEFEDKLKKDFENKVLDVNETETYYRARAMKVGVEELRSLAVQQEPLDQDTVRNKYDMERLVKNAKKIKLDYDSSRFSLDEVTKAAAFLTRIKEYGYSSELDVIDNPILYKKVADEKDPSKTKLKKRGYFEKKSIKKSAKKFRTKYKEFHAARVADELKRYKDKDIYDIGEDVSYDAQIKFTREDIDKVRKKDVLKVNPDDPVSRYVLGLPAEKKDTAKEISEKQRIDKLYEDFGELQGLMNTDIFKKHLVMHPSVMSAYARKAVFTPGLYVGVGDLYVAINSFAKWLADPAAYGFVESDDPEANGGLNTARLKTLEHLIKQVLTLSSMARQAEEYKGFVNGLLTDGDSFGVTEGETKETVKPHTRKAAEKAKRVTAELATRSGAAMRGLIDMHKDILRCTGYLGSDKKNKNNIDSLPSFKDYFGKVEEYVKFDD